MTSIGETLRRERTKRNLDLDQISRDLKISCRMLTAIENERFDQLPGGVFSRSFVRQYARYLGLDEQEFAVRLSEILEPAAPPAPQFPAETTVQPVASPIQLPRLQDWQALGGGGGRSVWRSPLVSLGMVVVAMLGCAGIYAWWQRTPHTVKARQTSEVEEQAALPSAAPARNPAAASDSVNATQPAAAQLSPAVEAGPAVSSNAPVRVELTAAEPAWVEMKSDGHITFSGVLETNQSRAVDANTMVVLILGNAGGVSISLNGKSIGSVGGKGQVRNLQLTSGGFEIVPPKPAASLDDM